jgi:hypothetical protein
MLPSPGEVPREPPDVDRPPAASSGPRTLEVVCGMTCTIKSGCNVRVTCQVGDHARTGYLTMSSGVILPLPPRSRRGKKFPGQIARLPDSVTTEETAYYLCNPQRSRHVTLKLSNAGAHVIVVPREMVVALAVPSHGPVLPQKDNNQSGVVRLAGGWGRLPPPPDTPQSGRQTLGPPDPPSERSRPPSAATGGSRRPNGHQPSEQPPERCSTRLGAPPMSQRIRDFDANKIDTREAYGVLMTATVACASCLADYDGEMKQLHAISRRISRTNRTAWLARYWAR